MSRKVSLAPLSFEILIEANYISSSFTWYGEQVALPKITYDYNYYKLQEAQWALIEFRKIDVVVCIGTHFVQIWLYAAQLILPMLGDWASAADLRLTPNYGNQKLDGI